MLYPTVMREVLLGAARAGFFQPIWSERILEEWRRASIKHGPDIEAAALSEIALTRAAWPHAVVHWPPSLEQRLWLPDPHDVHVLAAAVASSADLIVTVNAKDFPRNALAEESVSRADPDAFLMGFAQAKPNAMEAIVSEVHATAERLAHTPLNRRAVLKKARLPRLAKAFGQV